MRIPYVRETLAHLGYPLSFATIMGAAKGLAVVALLVPRYPRLLKEWAYAGVFFVYVGRRPLTGQWVMAPGWCWHRASSR
jgi:DoxX-like family